MLPIGVLIARRPKLRTVIKGRLNLPVRPRKTAGQISSGHPGGTIDQFRHEKSRTLVDAASQSEKTQAAC
jgi:hypothetical protein